MDKKYTKTTYKNIEGFEVDFEEYKGGSTEITLWELDEVDGEKTRMFETYSISEAYKTIVALQKVLRAHDDSYEEKMIAAMSEVTKDSIIL